MKKQSIENGGWFYIDRAEKYEEDTYWNGNNHISKATGSQWNHEDLYRSRKGKWIKHTWSQMQGSGETWEIVSKNEAAEWLIANEHEIPDDLGDIAESLEQ